MLKEEGTGPEFSYKDLKASFGSVLSELRKVVVAKDLEFFEQSTLYTEYKYGKDALAFRVMLDHLGKHLCLPSESVVASIGCGRGREAGAVECHLTEAGKSLVYFGYDIDPCVIDDAKEIYPVGRFNFQALDLTKTDSDMLVSCADLVFSCHQEFLGDPDIWPSIFKKGLGMLKPDGRLLITSFTSLEHREASEAILNLGAKLEISIENPFSRVVRSAIEGREEMRLHGHVAVFSK